MAYGRKNYRMYGKGRATTRRRSAPRRPRVSVKTRPKRVAVARKSRVDKIARQVRSLQVAKYGSPQVQRQSFRSTQGLGVVWHLTNTTPKMFCQEAIHPGNQVYWPDQDGITGDYNANTAGGWVVQPFPPTSDLAANARYDLQLYRNQKNEGFETTYLIRGVGYDIQIFAEGFNGFVQCYEISCKSQVTRAIDQDYKLPYSAASFVNMCQGGDTQYSQSSQFFNIKKKWTEYFNTAPDSATSESLHTNNLRFKRMYKSYGRGKLITGTTAVGGTVTQQDIPTSKQSWLLFTASNNDESAGSYVRIQVQRDVYWYALCRPGSPSLSYAFLCAGVTRSDPSSARRELVPTPDSSLELEVSVSLPRHNQIPGSAASGPRRRKPLSILTGPPFTVLSEFTPRVCKK